MPQSSCAQRPQTCIRRVPDGVSKVERRRRASKPHAMPAPARRGRPTLSVILAVVPAPTWTREAGGSHHARDFLTTAPGRPSGFISPDNVALKGRRVRVEPSRTAAHAHSPRLVAVAFLRARTFSLRRLSAYKAATMADVADLLPVGHSYSLASRCGSEIIATAIAVRSTLPTACPRQRPPRGLRLRPRRVRADRNASLHSPRAGLHGRLGCGEHAAAKNQGTRACCPGAGCWPSAAGDGAPPPPSSPLPPSYAAESQPARCVRSLFALVLRSVHSRPLLRPPEGGSDSICG